MHCNFLSQKENDLSFYVLLICMTIGTVGTVVSMCACSYVCVCVYIYIYIYMYEAIIVLVLVAVYSGWPCSWQCVVCFNSVTSTMYFLDCTLLIIKSYNYNEIFLLAQNFMMHEYIGYICFETKVCSISNTYEALYHIARCVCKMGGCKTLVRVA